MSRLLLILALVALILFMMTTPRQGIFGDQTVPADELMRMNQQ